MAQPQAILTIDTRLVVLGLAPATRIQVAAETCPGTDGSVAGVDLPFLRDIAGGAH